MAGVIKLAPTGKGINFMANMKKQPYSNLANVKIALEEDPELTGKMRYDAFLDRILTGDPPREWRGDDDTRIATYLQQRRGMLTVSSRLVKEAIDYHARQSPCHCVLDWLRSLKWDGTPRVVQSLATYWRAPISSQQPQHYLEAIGRNFFVGLVARVKNPGCQLDEMLVFESGQGQGKTSALRILGAPWYAASHESVTQKDFFQDLQGKWLIEISELSAFTKSQIERVKHAISTPTDRFRGSYDARSTDHPRQCVFAGTTNSDEWLADETGGRRFWPVRCGLIDRERLTLDREQLFAEAVQLYRDHSEWWVVPAVTADIQAERQESDVWAEIVLPWCIGRPDVRVLEILEGALKFKPEQMDKWSQMRVAKILKLAKWTKQPGRSHKAWLPPELSEVETVETFN